jgi:hypothetical protein
MRNVKLKFFVVLLLSVALFTGCKEHYSDGERVGTVTKFSKAGVIWNSWDGLLNITQTGMNSSGEPFAFSIDNDCDTQPEKEKIIQILQEAQVKGWKIKISYHQVWGLKNIFHNRGESDYFVDSIEVLDKNFAKPLENAMNPQRGGRVIDTVYVVIDKSQLRRK